MNKRLFFHYFLFFGLMFLVLLYLIFYINPKGNTPNTPITPIDKKDNYGSEESSTCCINFYECESLPLYDIKGIYLLNPVDGNFDKDSLTVSLYFTFANNVGEEDSNNFEIEDLDIDLFTKSKDIKSVSGIKDCNKIISTNLKNYNSSFYCDNVEIELEEDYSTKDICFKLVGEIEEVSTKKKCIYKGTYEKLCENLEDTSYNFQWDFYLYNLDTKEKIYLKNIDLEYFKENRHLYLVINLLGLKKPLNLTSISYIHFWFWIPKVYLDVDMDSFKNGIESLGFKCFGPIDKGNYIKLGCDSTKFDDFLNYLNDELTTSENPVTIKIPFIINDVHNPDFPYYAELSINVTVEYSYEVNPSFDNKCLCFHLK